MFSGTATAPIFMAAEEDDGPLGRVRQQHGHPLFDAHVHGLQGVAEAVDLFVQLLVGQHAIAAEDGRFVAASLGQVRVDKDRRRIQPFGEFRCRHA